MVVRLSDTPTDESPTTELASDTRREAVADNLRRDIGDGLVAVDIEPTVDMWVRVAPDAWAEAANALAERGFDYFVFLSGIDWMPSPWGKNEDDPFAEPDAASEPDDAAGDADDNSGSGLGRGRAGGETRFQVFARLTNLSEGLGITVKADVPESLQMPTLVPTFAGANWHERETHEMFGITFVGHPDLRNIYLPTDFEGHPLRKDFPLLARHIKPWPGIVDVEPLPATDDDSADAVNEGGEA